MTPGQYVTWASREASRLGVSFEGTAVTIEQMIRDGQFRSANIFLDYDVKGNQLSRPGLDALLETALGDHSVSHVFIPRRDRLARPDNPIDGITLELQFRSAGITLVFTDKVAGPIQKGSRQDIAELIVSVVDYDRAGKDRRDLADKIIRAQLALANAGYSTGGRPPYGFRRWLVRDDGTRVRQLDEGERVRTRGQHVIWLPVPDDHQEMIVTRRILDLLKTRPATQVVKLLIDERIPSPDSGRVRTDNGVQHRTSGLWNQSTIVKIARNKLLVAVSSYGRRSMGDQLRVSADGPRLLTEQDFGSDSKPKVVTNQDGIVSRQASFDPVIPVAEHDELIKVLDKRAGTQRGKPRSRDPARNPLGSRIFDLQCGWPMYRTPYNGSFRYNCGLYMQSRQCAHNHIDGPVATRFVLNCIQQKLRQPERRSKLMQRLDQLSKEQGSGSPRTAQLNALRGELDRVQADRSMVEKNMARASTEDQFRAIAKQFDEDCRKETDLKKKIDEIGVDQECFGDPDAQVQAALRVMDRLPDLVADNDDLQKVGESFAFLNVRLFLRFEKRQVKKRVLNKLQHGIMTFGDAEPPTRLYAGPTSRRDINLGIAATVAAGSEGDVPLPNRCCDGREGSSSGNVNRGDRIRTCDLLVPNQTLCQAELRPVVVGISLARRARGVNGSSRYHASRGNRGGGWLSYFVMPRLARILVYPIKSFDGVAADEARVLPSGALENDRRWALFDEQGRFVNGKRTPRMHLLRSGFDIPAGRVTISFDGTERTFSLGSDRPALEAWLSAFFDLAARLEENAAAGFPDDTAAPGPTIISTATLEAVTSWFPGLTIDDVRRRFRANLEIDGVEPFWEDRLYSEAGQTVRFRVGGVLLEGTNPCQRCVVPTRSPDTGERYADFTAIFERERYETLPDWATRSRFDHFYRLAVNTRPVPGRVGVIRVGDDVHVI